MSFAGLKKKVETEKQKKNTEVSLDALVPNPRQIRSSMNTQSIKTQIEEIKNVILSGGKIDDRLIVEPILDQFGEIEYPERYLVIAGHNRRLGLLEARKEALEYNKSNPEKTPKPYIESVEVVIEYNLTDKDKRVREYLSNRSVHTHILDEARYIVAWANEDGLDECLAITGISRKKYSELKKLDENLDPELRQLLIEKEIRTPQTIRDIKKLEPGEKKDWILSEIQKSTFSRGMLKRKSIPKIQEIEKIDEETGQIVVIEEIVEEQPKPKKTNSVSVNRKVMAHILKELKGQTIDPDSEEIIAEFKQFVEEIKQKDV